MSATGRSDVRRADDHYITPAWVTRALVPHLSMYDSALDPCAGEGAILDELSDHYGSPRYHGIELDAGRACACTSSGFSCSQGDALICDWMVPHNGKPYDLIVMNPPYSLALEFIKKALASHPKEIAVLLRLNFLASKKRAAFWKTHPNCDVLVLPKRPSFTGKGTDATEYAWFVFRMARRGCSQGRGHWTILDV
jgi:hypothetical protein